jgi:hypothetical protein
MEEVGGPGRTLALTGVLDRQAAELLQIEIRRLARRHGLTISGLRVERADGEDAAPAEGTPP